MSQFLQLASLAHNNMIQLTLRNIRIGGVLSLIETFTAFPFPDLTAISLHNTTELSNTRANVDEHGLFVNISAPPTFPQMATLTTLSYVDVPGPWPVYAPRVFPFRS